jgi:diguanylate cyclase (GGDEF)-like protein
MNHLGQWIEPARERCDDPASMNASNMSNSGDAGGVIPKNRRILLIDDNVAIHDDFRKILMETPSESELDELEAALFGEECARDSVRFDLDSAHQGQEGAMRVQQALASNAPYALAFVDMRMPPGWDGVQTIKRLWELDPSLQIVIYTAYSDYTWEETFGLLEAKDRLLVLKKPFDPIEVYQLASAMTEKWHLMRQVALKMADMERLVAARTADLRNINARLEALATTDPLTGLHNHRSLVDAMDHELARCDRFRRSCSVLFLDLDHFKSLNDSCGHAAGDAALFEVGQLLKRCLRGIDTSGRWGGEEFVALLPETDRTEALQIAERVRAEVATHLFAIGGGAHMTCSVGVAVYPEDGADRTLLLAEADKAMYAAKRLGRNQVRTVRDAATLDFELSSESSREETALLGAVEALLALLGARDRYTGAHTDDVTRLAVEIAMELGLDATQTQIVSLVAKLHDIGKVGIPDAILQKPERLTAEEWALIKQHPIIGAEVVERIPSLRVTVSGIRGHHERWDGKGYPDGLAGEQIALSARIISVADSYNAITTDRPYRRASDPSWALEELKRCAGTQFDPAVVEALQRILAARATDAAGQKAA